MVGLGELAGDGSEAIGLLQSAAECIMRSRKRGSRGRARLPMRLRRSAPIRLGAAEVPGRFGLDLLASLLAAAGYGAVPVAVAGWLLQRLRSRRRNSAGVCASCARTWSDIEAQERFLIHGRLVCEGCASKARRRLGWQFGLLGAAGIVSSVAILVSDDPAILALVPPTVVGVFAVGTVGIMKLANRRAQAQIAAGSYPFLPR